MVLTLAEAQARLSDLVHTLRPGEEVAIVENERTVARLLVGGGPKRSPRRAGNCAGLAVIVADDDDHLKDFAEYMG